MQIHELKRTTKNHKAPRVGRGGKRGKTSGRGTKGQLARAGHKVRPQMRDTIKKIPKLRGRGRNFLKSIVLPNVVINLSVLDKHFASGDSVSRDILVEKKLVSINKGSTAAVKILGTGDITKKLIVSDCLVSSVAKEKIEKAGGTIAL
jgi:large subunit ribosomal protein L15